tara:strand:- start:428 stop:892 length:465 start_codon:yes stop_codon:yes gene_type:complete
MKKKPEIKYGIEIVKPWSSEMYDHNDVVSEEMKKNIIKKWDTLIKDMGDINMETPWTVFQEYTDIVKLQKGICYSGFGDGYTLGDVDEEFRKEVDMMANWQLHETYSYLAFEGMLPRTSFMLIGFEWEKFDYHIIGSQECTSPVLSLSFHNDKS